MNSHEELLFQDWETMKTYRNQPTVSAHLRANPRYEPPENERISIGYKSDRLQFVPRTMQDAFNNCSNLDDIISKQKEMEIYIGSFPRCVGKTYSNIDHFTLGDIYTAGLELYQLAQDNVDPRFNGWAKWFVNVLISKDGKHALIKIES